MYGNEKRKDYPVDDEMIRWLEENGEWLEKVKGWMKGHQ